MQSNHFPRIATVFEGFSGHSGNLLYDAPIRNALRHVYPNELFAEDDPQGWLKAFHEQLPLVKWSEGERKVSVVLLCRHRPRLAKFFYDLISHWLLPGKLMKASFFFASDFRLPDLDEGEYSLVEMLISVDDEADLALIQANIPIIETELKIGVHSAYHANRILEIKGLAADEKHLLVQERISALMQKRPKDFDYDIFSQMQHFLVLCRDEFKAMRTYEHLSRIVGVFYLFRKYLRLQIEDAPTRRHLILKLIKARLQFPLGMKRVLGIFVGLNLLKQNEVFEQRHLIKAIQNHIPGVIPIEDSYCFNEGRDEPILTLYLEIEKTDGADFSLEEIGRLRRELPDDLKGSVEQLMRPVFMPRNEEEVMRNIVTLSQQLRYTRDIPQVIISFDEQTDKDLSFTIILLRVLQPGSASIQELFQGADSHLEFIPDRVKRVGMLRKKYPKEATVFRVKLPNSAFLRGDHSLDLYKARLEVGTELQRVIGEVRDFNGGMISKQIEVFLSLKKALGEIGQQNEFLLENFFHSIFPVELRSVIDAVPLKELFMMLLEALESKEAFFKSRKTERCVFALAALDDFSMKQKVFEAVETLHIRSPHLLAVDLKVFDTACLGYIYFSDDPLKQELFLQKIEDGYLIPSITF